jgi:polysaccharide biosynthesis transport protein
MELKTYMAILWRRKWLILLATIVVTTVATITTLLSKPVYTSSTTLRVATIGGGVIEGRTDINYSIRLMNTYATIINSGTVRAQIRDDLGLSQNPQITVEIIPDTELMRINTQASNPQTAHDVAEAAANVLIAQSLEIYSGTGQSTREILNKQLEQTQEELSELRAEYQLVVQNAPDDVTRIGALNQSIDLKERTYESLLGQYEEARVNEALRSNAISIVDRAYVPNSPSKPRHELNIAIGVVVGLMLGVAVAFVVENLDTTLYTIGQIEAVTKLPTVGKIPLTKNELKIIRFDNGFKPEVEAFRRLRTNILSGNKSNQSQVFMVTSAESGEGKSTIMANLAVSMAQSGRRVVIVDCDMRQSTLHVIFDQPNKRGLTDILLGNTSLTDTIQETAYPRVSLITSGSLPPNPTELLGSTNMESLLVDLKEQYDMVLLDTPALLSVTDAAVLAPRVDAVVLVVARNRSNKVAVQSVRRELENVNVKSVGVIINRAEKNGYPTY